MARQDAAAASTAATVDAIAEARLILCPTQQPLPKEQAAALEQAIHAWDAGQPETAHAHLEQAMALAREGGYL